MIVLRAKYYSIEVSKQASLATNFNRQYLSIESQAEISVLDN
jgi:hypothetical protein